MQHKGQAIKIFITGATGFVGSHVLQELLSRGHDVYFLKRPRSNDWRITEYAQYANAHALIMELDDKEALEKVFRNSEFDAIIHLAWAGVKSACRDDEIQHLNFANTMQLLHMAVSNSVKHFIGLGSQAEYGPCENIIDENQPARPDTIYGRIKLETAISAQKFCDQDNIRFAWLRLFSVYGPKDNEDFLIPYLIGKLIKSEKPSLTKCEQLWDYIYVTDAAKAICDVLAVSEAQGIMNLGSGKVQPLKHVVELVCENIDSSLPIGFGEVSYKPDQIMHLQADISKLCSATGWQPQTSIEKGIAETVAWYKANIASQNQ